MSSTRQAKEFRFVDYQISSDRSSISFNYSTDDFHGNILEFCEVLDLNGIKIPSEMDGDAELAHILQGVHIALGINYYKPFIPKNIILPYELNESLATFWKEVYKNGLGEFCYLNNIDPKTIGNFQTNAIEVLADDTGDFRPQEDQLKVLTGIGGGKDSLVAVEIIKGLPSVKQSGFICESISTNNPLRRKLAENIGLTTAVFTRIPDKKLEEIRSGGEAYRGHTPASVIIAWAGVLCSKILGSNYFVVANENSSNEANVEWMGHSINHQWTKTLAFERKLSSVLRNQGISVGYFSIVRPLNELLISQLFVSLGKRYFSTFFSCNKGLGHKTGLWCGKCAKCASSTLLLAPFLEIDQLTTIIGRNMLDDKSLIGLFEDLLGFGSMKPFDCVCTYDEALVIIKSLSTKADYKDLAVVRSLSHRIEQEDIDWQEKINAVYKMNEGDLPSLFEQKIQSLFVELEKHKVL